MTKGYKEVRGKLGVFGIMWRILFWGWQILMLFSCAVGFVNVGEELTRSPAPRDAWEETVIGVGITLGLGMNFVLWASGSIVFGIPVLLTRPARAMVKEE